MRAGWDLLRTMRHVETTSNICWHSLLYFSPLHVSCRLGSVVPPEQTHGHAHAYEGAARPATQIATVFVASNNSLLAYICAVDGKNYFKLTLISGPCGHVVYCFPAHIN